jgi:oxygen-dependent protoporphyrinogen oxidase
VSARGPVVVVVGGGITGLSAARVLLNGSPSGGDRRGATPTERTRAAHEPAEVVVLEASPRLGGKIATSDLGGHLVDLGPDNFLTADPAAERLCWALGLGDELESPARGSATIRSRGRFHRLPAGLVLGVPSDLGALFSSSLLSRPGAARAGLDLLLPRMSCPKADPTVAEVLQPRLGREILDRLVDPILGGINAGSIDSLSFSETMARVATATRGERSVMLALSRARQASLLTGAQPRFIGLRTGMERLVDALVAELRANSSSRIETSARVSSVSRSSEKFLVHYTDGRTGATSTLLADGVVFAAPPAEAGAVLANLDSGLASDLRAIPSASVAVAGLVWPAAKLAPRTTTGFLVPRVEGGLLTAVTFTSTKWPGRHDASKTVLRGFVGRFGDERHQERDDDTLLAEIEEELAAMLHISSPPTARVLQRWQFGLPQYLSGHARRVATIRARAAAIGVEVAGAGVDGLGIPACIAAGERAGLSLARRLGSFPATGTGDGAQAG